MADFKVIHDEIVIDGDLKALVDQAGVGPRAAPSSSSDNRISQRRRVRTAVPRTVMWSSLAATPMTRVEARSMSGDPEP